MHPRVIKYAILPLLLMPFFQNCSGGFSAIEMRNSVPIGLSAGGNGPSNLPFAVASTSDTLLNTGIARVVNYSPTVSGSASSIATIQTKSDPKKTLWKLVPDPFNVASGTGTINMSYSGSGAIVSKVILSGINYATVNGYPFIGYGADVFGFQSSGQSPQFPASIESMSSLMIDTSYSLEGTFNGNIDVLFDQWLMPTPTYSGGPQGSVEIEVLPYFKFLGSLYGIFVKNFDVPVVLNGKSTTLTFKEYVSTKGVGAGAGSLVLFYPTQNLIAADLHFDMMVFMREGAATAAVPSTWYVAGVQLGTEFGGSTTQDFTFTVNKLGIEQTNVSN